MKIKFKASIKSYISLFAVVLFWALVLTHRLPFSVFSAFLISAFVLACSFFEITLENAPLFSLALPCFLAGVCTVAGQYVSGFGLSEMSFEVLICNFILTLSLFYIVQALSGRVKFSLIFSFSALFVLYFINYALILFRGRGLSINDIYSIKIALSVSGNYEFTLTPRALWVLVLFLVILYAIINVKMPKCTKEIRFASLGGALLCVFGMYLSTLSVKAAIQNWGDAGTRVNGVAYNLFVEVEKSQVDSPVGYSTTRVEEILSRYDTAGETAEDTPHIIVIMDEAWSDLTVLGDFELSTDPLAFYKSLEENTYKGNALCSILGGGTATSEWEFLTGNTAAFLPHGAIAYQQYVKNHIWSIVPTLEENGYTSVAMHPYLKTGWKRDVVYSLMGFDEMYFMDEMSHDDLVRTLVSDKSHFSDIIKRYEERDAHEKLFMFNVTMQNHGGYNWDYPNTVNVDGNWFDVEQYLTLIKMTDEALQDLIGYFEKEDEKVMIVFFGDHQPSLNAEFYKTVLSDKDLTFEEVQRKHTVPFFIWTNYDSEEKTNARVSFNFLSAIMLEKAGIPLPAYMAFLLDVHKTIPQINTYGFYSLENAVHTRTAEATGKDAKLIEEWRILQYNNLFGSLSRSKHFK